ncbi:hypothetical protein EI74_0635 [Mycoplasma testudineum]|uniref:Uncharacterized protein n=1 Tax=Mycoplasma testudineum TaxID=244584 RepID=A0A4R6IC63_9MOLU|nr:hypothetical protein [Mycoplasma testudineum]OYD26700.1 hypothetical protein CG473_02780 [Mycoplasma testudineum]TDO19830.1 hypothetical protein EI74_0635 [Mycoplasma testudineum]
MSKEINWEKSTEKKTVDKSEIRSIINKNIQDVPHVVQYHWHNQKVVLTILNKEKLGISSDENIKINEETLNEYDKLINFYLNKD